MAEACGWCHAGLGVQPKAECGSDASRRGLERLQLCVCEKGTLKAELVSVKTTKHVEAQVFGRCTVWPKRSVGHCLRAAARLPSHKGRSRAVCHNAMC